MGDHGIRVNTLVPGFFPAEQNRKVLTPDRVAKIMGHTPMDRFGDAGDVIGATLLSASRAGSFITGHEMIVDGGFSSMTIWRDLRPASVQPDIRRAGAEGQEHAGQARAVFHDILSQAAQLFAIGFSLRLRFRVDRDGQVRVFLGLNRTSQGNGG